MMMKLALLKRPLPGLKHYLAHYLGSLLDKSKYSHSNVIFSDGLSGSSWAEDGVCFKQISYDVNLWDIFYLPLADEGKIRAYYESVLYKKYDYLGVLRFVFKRLHHDKNKYFCHELIPEALGWSNPWKYGPSLLLSTCKDKLGAIAV